MKTKSAAAATVSVPSSTGTGAGSAGSSGTITGIAGITSAISGGAPIVAPKGFRLELSQMLAGFEQVIPTGSAIPYQGTTLTQASIVSQLQGFQGNYTSLDSTELAQKTARAAVTQAEAPAKALLAELKVALTAFYGATSPQLARFGLKPKGARKPLTVAQEAERVARMKATRAIRGTKGKNQKAALTASAATTAAPAASGTPAEPVASVAAVVPTQVK